MREVDTEKEKSKGKPNNKRPLLKIVLFFMLLGIGFVAYQFYPRHNMTPFFADIEADSLENRHSQAELLILEYVTIGESTSDDVDRFIENVLLADVQQVPVLYGFDIPQCNKWGHLDNCTLPNYATYGSIDMWDVIFGYGWGNTLLDVRVDDISTCTDIIC